MVEKPAFFKNPWAWVPTLYFAEGIPYVLVMSASVVFYKRMGVSNTDIAFYTSWLYLPWVIKPLWSPFVDLFKTKRSWILGAQLLVGAGLGGVALTAPLPGFFRWTLLFFWLLAFSSATHDIAADGFYMLALTQRDQAFFVGIRSTFYRFAMIAGQGLLVMLAGFLETSTGKVPLAWSITFFLSAGLFLLFFLYHRFVLPRPPGDGPAPRRPGAGILEEFWRTFVLFFKKKDIVSILAFLLLYRLGEAQLAKLASPFLLDAREAGGLGLSTEAVGFAYGTVGVLALIAGGVLGGIAASRKGLKFWLWWMAIAINLPDAVYIYLSYALPDNQILVYTCIAVEQFGYGFGFTAYMLFMIYASRGDYKTAHFALTTGFMALGMMLPGMISGWIQKNLGYQHFFIWVMIATIPAFLACAFVKIDPEFGKKEET